MNFLFGFILLYVCGWVNCQGIDTSLLASAVNNALIRHNVYRQNHNSPNLTLDPVLTSLAQQYANSLASKATISLAHSSNATKGVYGENLYVTYSSMSPSNSTINSTGVKGSKSWYDEIKFYNFNNGGFSSSTGHFTALVWKSSTKVGLGIAKGYQSSSSSSSQKYYALYLVANYYPTGNMIGSFTTNVLKPIKDLTTLPAK